jgi:hypothetical protein
MAALLLAEDAPGACAPAAWARYWAAMGSLARRLTVDEFHRLVEAGIVGPVKLFDGRIVIGTFDLAFSDAQIAAALRVGVDLSAAHAIEEFGGTLDQHSYPPGYLEREREGWRE